MVVGKIDEGRTTADRRLCQDSQVGNFHEPIGSFPELAEGASFEHGLDFVFADPEPLGRFFQ
jgi:hypothetical protein